jgi:hypothetical protein
VNLPIKIQKHAIFNTNCLGPLAFHLHKKGLLMKTLSTCCLLFLSVLLLGCDDQTNSPKKGSLIGPGGLPPAYLAIKNTKPCFDQKNMGSWQSVCLPKRKPKQCQSDSWTKLQALSGKDRPPACE